MDKEGKYQQKKRVLTFVIPVQEPTNDNTEKIMDPEFEDENALKSEEEVFPDNLDNVENM